MHPVTTYAAVSGFDSEAIPVKFDTMEPLVHVMQKPLHGEISASNEMRRIFDTLMSLVSHPHSWMLSFQAPIKMDPTSIAMSFFEAMKKFDSENEAVVWLGQKILQTTMNIPRLPSELSSCHTVLLVALPK